jgi:Zn-dependent peptidase ImmA (M78 family)/transcriptional regulator with XRE-family HTH domain
MGDLDRIVGSAVRKARERLGWSQAELAEKAGFGHGQIVSQIEKGERPLKAVELAALSRILYCDLAALLEDRPGTTVGVLWRGVASPSPELEARFVQDCEHYRVLEELCDAVTETRLPPPRTMPADLDDAAEYGKEVRGGLGLGAYPADSLKRTLEEVHGVKLFFETKPGVSAACTAGSFGLGVLLNGSETPWRRNFSLAHELFHLLTWDVTSPQQLREDPLQKDRVEKLANAFASALLLPAEEVLDVFKAKVKEAKIHYGDLVEMARLFNVSTEALVWRLVNLDRIEKTEAKRVLDDRHFRAMDRTTMPEQWVSPPGYFPERFVHLGFTAWQRGRLSRAKLAEFLQVSLSEMGRTLEQYGLSEDEDYEATLSVA